MIDQLARPQTTDVGRNYLKQLAGRPLSVCFDAYRTKAYDGGGEENLTFQVSF